MAIKKLLNRIDALLLSEKWNIGYIHQTAAELIQKQRLDGPIYWLEPDASDFSADPFIIKKGSKYIIYFEDMKGFGDKGELYVMSNFDFNTKEKVKGIKPEKIHYSYPYLFEDNGLLYCLPESAEAGEVALYEVDHDDLSVFKRKKILVSGRQYVDSSLIKFNDYYWLITTDKNDPQSLFIFYSSTVNGEYVPHLLNPISADPQTSRGAGSLFIVDGNLYRPSQNHRQTYGGSILISQIIALSTTSFSSDIIFELKPKSPYKRGLHNISFSDNRIVVDGSTRQFVFSNVKRKIQRKLNKHQE